jgi:putative membrane protein
MPSGLRTFLQRWAIATLAVIVAVYLVDGIRYEKPLDVLIASLLLGILNTVLRPLLVALSISLVVFTLGLFLLVINALLLWLVGSLLKPHFVVDGFWPAFWGALIISVVSMVLNTLTGAGGSSVQITRGKSSRDDDKSGPVIDV